MKTEDLIRAAVARCDRIVAGFDDLRPMLAPVLPVTGDGLAELPLQVRIASIALLKRYEQLQDMLGRLFRAYLTWEMEDVREMTRRDQANQLEKLGIVADADDWIGAAELRNRLAHEYPIDEGEQVDRVNDTWLASITLIEAYGVLKARLANKGLLS
ncbi:MAG TPA: hypothetical protein VF695_16085 [Sphingomonas sp.]|jgi:hypothetical protein